MSYLDTDALALTLKAQALATETADRLQQQLSAARETNELMRRALERTSGMVKELREERQALSGALLRMAHYARHLSSCSTLDHPGNPNSTFKCDCGLVDVTDEATKAVSS